MAFKNLLSHLTFQKSILIAFLIRLLITGANVGDAICIIALAALFGGMAFMEYKKIPDVNIEFKKELDVIKAEIVQLKSNQNAIKMAPKTQAAPILKF